ncbi:hypothetical protein [Dactylosporangium sp. CA-233914]|uniref:hypothetical protein n=1 Tax=Dactylosporangium sp. CA-233914 TaxID=3239934 RepID=UPI003D8A6193
MRRRWSLVVVLTAVALMVYLISTDHLPPHGPAPLSVAAHIAESDGARDPSGQTQLRSDDVTIIPRTAIFAAVIHRDIPSLTVSTAATAGRVERQRARAGAGPILVGLRPDLTALRILRC